MLAAVFGLTLTMEKSIKVMELKMGKVRVEKHLIEEAYRSIPYLRTSRITT